MDTKVSKTKTPRWLRGLMLDTKRGRARKESPQTQRRAIKLHSAFNIPSTVFLASPNSIMVLSRKNSSFSTPA